jgi:hypothetical protein
VWKLDASLGLRIQLGCVFALGSFVVFTAIYRFTTLFQFDRTDTTWTLATSCAWVVVEVASGVISVCLPTLGPLVQCGAWKQRSRAVRAASGMSSGGSGGKRSLPTQVYVVDDEQGATFERLNSVEARLPHDARQPVVVPEVQSFELGTHHSRRDGNRSDTDLESDGEMGWNGSTKLAPPPRSSMIRR